MASISDKTLFDDYVLSERRNERMELLFEIVEKMKEQPDYDAFKAYINALNVAAHTPKRGE